MFSFTSELSTLFLLNQITQILFYIVLTHLFRWYVLRVGWLKFKWYSLLPRFFIGTFVLGVLHTLFIIISTWLTGDLNPESDLNVLSLVANLFVSMTMFLIWSLFYLSFHYFERYNRSLQYEASLKEVELNNLKSQLNPHFIFNALNSIRALVDENPAKSKDAITRLSNILRNSLSSERQKLIPFDDELKTVKDYLELESVRYEERLKTAFDIDPNSNSYLIPPLMIQTLVENGIKHGVSTLKGGGLIKIITKVENNSLRIIILNTGKFVNGRAKGMGYGLSNTEKRLELIYGEEASFSIGNEGNEVKTEILIPNNL